MQGKKKECKREHEKWVVVKRREESAGEKKSKKGEINCRERLVLIKSLLISQHVSIGLPFIRALNFFAIQSIALSIHKLTL